MPVVAFFKGGQLKSVNTDVRFNCESKGYCFHNVNFFFFFNNLNFNINLKHAVLSGKNVLIIIIARIVINLTDRFVISRMPSSKS